MTVHYEWDIEEVIDYPDGLNDVTEHLFQSSYAEVKRSMGIFKPHKTPHGDVHYDPVLVRDDDNGRSWAYMKDGKLPTHFEDAYQKPVAKVPQRFHAEVAKAG